MAKSTMYYNLQIFETDLIMYNLFIHIYNYMHLYIYIYLDLDLKTFEIQGICIYIKKYQKYLYLYIFQCI